MDLLIVFIKLATALAGLAREVLRLIDARREGRDAKEGPGDKPRTPPRHLSK